MRVYLGKGPGPNKVTVRLSQVSALEHIRYRQASLYSYILGGPWNNKNIKISVEERHRKASKRKAYTKLYIFNSISVQLCVFYLGFCLQSFPLMHILILY